MSPREYWAFAFKQRDSNLAHDKRDKSQAVAARADLKFALKVREGSHAKRAPLDSQCEQTEEGIYCTYTSADVEAYGTAGRLQDGCLTVSTGVTCFYPGAKPEDIVSRCLVFGEQFPTNC